jgi:Flp pilus assembly pilin Flp
LWHEEEGQDLAEYGRLIVLIALAAITSIRGLATAIEALFTGAAASLSAT